MWLPPEALVQMHNDRLRTTRRDIAADRRAATRLMRKKRRPIDETTV